MDIVDTFCTERAELYFLWDASLEVSIGKTEASDQKAALPLVKFNPNKKCNIMTLD